TSSTWKHSSASCESANSPRVARNRSATRTGPEDRMIESGVGGDGLHVAVIMDGNGRWAQARGLPRQAGHTAGAAAVEPIVRAASGLGITRLTLFALSSDNWSRPAEEVDA